MDKLKVALRSQTLIAACLLGVSGCATSPDKINASYVSPYQFSTLNCDQLRTEIERNHDRVGNLHAKLKKKADNDEAQMAVGLILFLPVLLFLEGGDGPQAAEYARLKGEFDAMMLESTLKSCEIPVKRPREIEEKDAAAFNDSSKPFLLNTAEQA